MTPIKLENKQIKRQAMMMHMMMMRYQHRYCHDRENRS